MCAPPPPALLTSPPLTEPFPVRVDNRQVVVLSQVLATEATLGYEDMLNTVVGGDSKPPGGAALGCASLARSDVSASAATHDRPAFAHTARRQHGRKRPRSAPSTARRSTTCGSWSSWWTAAASSTSTSTSTTAQRSGRLRIGPQTARVRACVHVLERLPHPTHNHTIPTRLPTPHSAPCLPARAAVARPPHPPTSRPPSAHPPTRPSPQVVLRTAAAKAATREVLETHCIASDRSADLAAGGAADGHAAANGETGTKKQRKQQGKQQQQQQRGRKGR